MELEDLISNVSQFCSAYPITYGIKAGAAARPCAVRITLVGLCCPTVCTSEALEVERCLLGVSKPGQTLTPNNRNTNLSPFRTMTAGP